MHEDNDMSGQSEAHAPSLNLLPISTSVNPDRPCSRAAAAYCVAMGWRGWKSVPKASKVRQRDLRVGIGEGGMVVQLGADSRMERVRVMVACL